MALIDNIRERVKQRARDVLGVELSEADLAYGVEKAMEAMPAKLEEIELRHHLASHHYTAGPLTGFGPQALRDLHAVAPEQGSHPVEEAPPTVQ